MFVSFASVRHVIRSPHTTGLATLLCAGVLGFALISAQAAQASERGSALPVSSQDRTAHAGSEAQPRHGVRALFGIGRRPLGRAPYVCTPSGFGRTATCSLRSTTNSALN